MLTISILIERYLSNARVLHYAPTTITVHRCYLRLLTRFLEESAITDAAAVTTITLQDFQRWLFDLPTAKGKTRGVAHQNQILVAVKNLFRFLAEEHIIPRDPAAALSYAREPATLPRHVLTPKEAKKILEAPDTGTIIGYRDRTILEVLYATGIRHSELRALTTGNVNLEEELLRINLGKGGKDRVVPLSRVACAFLESYIKGIRPRLLRDRGTQALFLSLRAKPLGKTSLDLLLEKYARRSGVKKHVTCHVWRHTCATHLLQNNANLRHVQEILGHKNLTTTERYLRLTITDLKEAHRKFHPREQQRAS
jgi:integrase/recombinase XerD